MAPMQDPDELKYGAKASIFKWTPICITPITPGTVTPAKVLYYQLKFYWTTTCVKQRVCLCVHTCVGMYLHICLSARQDNCSSNGKKPKENLPG